MSHTILTFVAKVDPSRVSDLAALLAEIETDPRSNPHVPFGALAKLHFGSLVIFPDDTFGPYLVFEHNFDGDLEPYLADLWQHAGAGLHRIYGHCLDYDGTGSPDRERLLAYLRARVVRPNAWHIGNVGRTATRVRQEAALRAELDEFLDGERRQSDRSPAAIRQRIQEFVQRTPSLSWTRQAVGPRLSFGERLVPWLRLGGLGLVALLLLPVLLPLLIVYLIVLRRRERTDPVVIEPPAPEHIRRLAAREDNAVQNHLANISYVKPGMFRGMTMRAILFLTNLVARVSTRGKLSGLTSLHFAHWALIDDGRRLLFLTNYDGSWENYLDDFIDKASIGLTGIWSNTVNFPRTRFLVLGGAQDERRFKTISRRNQVYSNVWYSAYDRLTVQAIDNNSAIREQLLGPLDEEQTRKWLWRF
jgi:hypothetical protein